LKWTHNWRDNDMMLVWVKHATWLGYPFIRICIPVHGTMDKEAVTPWAFYTWLVDVTLGH
jgi:hypothetical protein